MFNRYSYGAVALFATTALTQPWAAEAQDQSAPPASQDAPEEADRVLGPVVVRGQFIPDEKRETSEVSSLVDAGDFALRGDSDVASALRRVTGVSIDSGGKFVYVRGLNERYSSSLLNGSVIPSPEPLKKVAPLDLFPTSVLESTLVQKTFSPEQPGEFAGGVIDIRTRALPDNNFFDIGFSISANSETTFDDGLLHDGSDSDFFGYDDGTRDLPAGLEGVLSQGGFNALSLSERNAFSSQLTQDASLLVVQEGAVPANWSTDLSVGRRYDVNEDLSVGFLGALSYSNDYSSREADRGIGEAVWNNTTLEFENLRALSNFNRRVTTNTVGANAYGSVGFDILDNHELKFVAFGTRSTDKKTESETGFSQDESNLLNERVEWIERQLWTTQVQGEHIFPDLLDLEIDWRASYSEANRDAPYQVFTQYEQSNNGTPIIREIAPGSSIEFSEIDDDATDFGIDAMLPLYLGDVDIELKAGYAYTEKDREADSNTFILQDALEENFRVDSAYRLYFDDGTQAFQNGRSNNSPAFYVATQEIDAGYVGIDAQLTPFMRIAAGARYEDFIQAIETRVARNGNGIITPPLEESSWLPAATLTWNFADDLQLRVGYSETVNRPQFREVGPSLFTNTDTNEQFIGNPFLEITDITNYDARLEWYFGREQFLTAGVFYKELEKPIEAINVGSGESRLVSFANIKAAEIQGFELEYQQGIPLHEWLGAGVFENKDFSITTNYTYSDSEIDASDPILVLDQTAIPNLGNLLSSNDGTILVDLYTDIPGQTGIFVGPAGFSNPEDLSAVDFANNFFRAVTERESDFDPNRQLQGLSQHLFNLQFGYRDDQADADVNVLVNFQSERIRSVETINDNSPAIVEEPPITLDFVYRKGFILGEGDYNFSIKVQNILNSEYKAFQEANGVEVPVDVYDPGTSFSISLKRAF
ncbi:MAG: TonB-dependent receptor [Pseudomonadota bacterium]